jgi:phosphate transport system permease protein
MTLTLSTSPSIPTIPSQRPERKTLGQPRRTDTLALGGAVAGATGATALLFAELTPLSGPLGAVVVWYVAFLGLYAFLVSMDESGPAVRDRLAAAAVHSLAVLLLTSLVLVISYTFYRGFSALGHINFFTHDMQQAGPLDPLAVGGILHAAVGTLEQISIALVITVPLGLACAVFLSEVPGTFARFVRTIAEAMTALPSIVAGLFIYATVILALGFEKSGFAAALALSVMMLPIIIRAADVVLRLVPGHLKEASYALGAGHWRTVWQVVLPTSRSGLATAVILGTARGIGETSPVLLTAGFSSVMNTNPLHGPQVSLPLAAFQFVRQPQATMIARGFGAAAALMLIVLLLFIAARVLGGRGAGNLSNRQQRRRTAASAADLSRFSQRPATHTTIVLPEVHR